MPGICSLDFVLVDSIPALLAGQVIVWEQETVGQVAGECKALVEDQGYAVSAVAGGGDDFTF